MPPKRRLSAIGGSDNDIGESSEDDPQRSATPEPGRKRKKIDPQQQMTNLFEFIRRYKKEDGSELCEPFIRAPKRRSEPSYYDVVTVPMDLLRIQQKIKTEEYESLDKLKEDFNLMIENSLAYYKKGTSEHRDALELKDLFEKALVKVEIGEDPAVSLGNREIDSEEELTEMLEDLFAAVMTATDNVDPNRLIHLPFRLLPSQKRYPEYYKVINEPFDLKMIATKIRDNEYTSLNQLEDDLALMTKNAMTFNEPGSQIYRDAKQVLKIVKSKKYELEANKVARENRGSRSTRRLQGKHHFSSEVAALQYEDSESEESEEDAADYDLDDPLWALYAHVRTFTTPSGICLAEPFLTLPSKRELPDYYQTIMEPISLNMIRKKLKNGEYSQLVDLADDLNTMFENCKSYNRPDSRLYKEGVKLQKIMNAKLEELEAKEDGDEDFEDEAGMGNPIQAGSSLLSDSLSPQQSHARKRMRVIYNTVLNYKNEDGIQLIGMFMEKPSKKDYPDYYEVIPNPIDMNTVNEKIKTGVYKTEDDFIQDMKLMFSNCRRYNEEGSDIYKDANVLERVMVSKARDLGLIVGPGRGRPSKKKNLSFSQKLKILFETLRDYKDSKGRQLSLIFLRLPNQREFADYYEVIKKPIDFEKISVKIKQNSYETLEEALADFVLMFDNACKYNEPDSQIYKDALSLQSLALRTVRSMTETESSMPDVAAAVQEILSSIFLSTYNHQDENERCYSDSLAELPENNEEPEAVNKTRALSLDIIKRRLDRGLYKRLDIFQRDMFYVFERARNLSRTDSQIFEDSVELQTYFIRTRDEVTGNGDVYQSRALLYTQEDLVKSVNALKAEKMVYEKPEATDETEAESGEKDEEKKFTFDSKEYHVGDFVYTDVEGGMEPYIFLIEKMTTDPVSEEPSLYGNQFFRPVETFHVPSRKFLENEVFRTDVHKNISFKDVVGKCWVMPVRDYFRYKPEGFEDKDIYVCESRYNSKARSFKKMKITWSVPEHIRIVERETELEPKRVMSVFKERIEKHKEEIEELERLEKTVEPMELPNIVWEYPPGTVLPQPPGDGITYYEQYTIPGPITLRRGDNVYVRAENGKNLIVQIDTMWTNPDGMAYFHGPWFVTPSETPHSPTQMFYKHEVFLSTISDTNPLLSAVGKCCVLDVSDYVSSRPTQYSENDVYVCESIYDETKRVIRGPLPNFGLKKYEHSVAVQTDEIYFFKKPISLQKEPSPLLPKLGSSMAMDVDNEDSLDAPPSVGSATADPILSTPTQKKVKAPSKKVVTAYILFSSEVRRVTTDENKNCSFGQISRIVGDKWRQLSDVDKLVYEERAKKINEENAIKFAEEQRILEERRRNESTPSVTSTPINLKNMSVSMMTPQQHQQQQQQQQQPQQQQQLQQQQQRTLLNASSPGPQGARILSSNGSVGTSTSGKAPEPIFHTVPPRPQRLLHSEAYIKYIEGLTADSQTMSNWEKQLKATKENTKTEEAKLPAHWLSDNGEHATSLDALWALREFMMTDSLGLYKIC